MSIENPADQLPCPICGAKMIFVHGSGWDYDRWHCVSETMKDGFPCYCLGEIELNDSTYPPGAADD